MFNQEKLLKIGELKLTGKEYEMDEYNLKLSEFIELFPEHEAGVKKAFEEGDSASLSAGFTNIRDLLDTIHADGLSQSYTKLLGEFDVLKRETLEANLNHLLTAAASLSIDIQMSECIEADGTVMGAAVPVIRPESSNAVKTILAVDDSPIILNWVKSALQNSGFKFIGLISGAAALKFLETRSPDLFLLDIEMPEMDGFELVRRIKENGHNAPIILLTGNSSREYVLKALQAGVEDFIVKPININNMLDKIKKYIG